MSRACRSYLTRRPRECQVRELRHGAHSSDRQGDASKWDWPKALIPGKRSHDCTEEERTRIQTREPTSEAVPNEENFLWTRLRTG